MASTDGEEIGPTAASSKHPLSLIFSPGGSILTNRYGYYPCESDQELQFTRNFKVKPFTFINQLQNLETRCFDNGVIFTPLKLTDSVDETVAKIRMMNRAIKTAKQKKRRENMSQIERDDAADQNIMRRRKRHAQESPAERQQRLKRHAASERQRSERAFEAECNKQDVSYTPPQHENESVSTKRAGRKKLRRTFAQDVPPKQQRQRRATIKCNFNSISEKSCNCNQSPPKNTFEVVGNESKIYASSTTSHSQYISTNTTALNTTQQCYWERYKVPYVQHLFNLDLNNIQQCPIHEVMDSDVRINGCRVVRVGDCKYTRARIDGNRITITHYFNPQEDKSPWGWEENLTLGVVSSLLPGDVLKQAQPIIDKFDQRKTWDGHQLYELMSDIEDITIKFNNLTFEEFSMKPGDVTYNIAKDEIYNKKMTNEYGPYWRKSWKLIKNLRQRNQRIVQKRMYWRCLKGWKVCHNNRCSCSYDCEINQLGGMETRKEDYVDCIDGHQMCHEGRLQCPRCCDANRLKNKPQWRCGNCNEIIGTHQQVVDHWDTCKRANILRDYGD